MKLNSLLLLVFVSLANGCGGSSAPARPSMSQKDAIDAIKKLGGRIELDDSGKLIGIRLDGTEVTNEDLVMLKGRNNLRFLKLNNTQISGSGLVHVKGLASLSDLWVGSTNITKDEVKELEAALPNCNIYPLSMKEYEQEAERKIRDEHKASR